MILKLDAKHFENFAQMMDLFHPNVKISRLHKKGKVLDLSLKGIQSDDEASKIVYLAEECI
jgi:hypothetical protein